MDIIKRNFFRLLQIGALGENTTVEPMSAYKWQRLFTLLDAHDVLNFALQGYAQQQKKNVRHASQQLVNELQSRQTTAPQTDYTRSQLSNSLLNRRLQTIRTTERHAIDTSLETLHLLNIIVHNVENTLNQGLQIKGILHLGLYLRHHGNRVDFIKLERWLAQIHLKTMAQLQGNILITLFGFEQAEIPFVRRLSPKVRSLILRSLTKTEKDTTEHSLTQDSSVWVHGNSTTIRHSLGHNMRYLLYAPIETISNLTYKFAKNLSELEE